MASKNAKKANLLDHHSLKHLLDESVSEIVTTRGYVEDVRLSNVKLIMGTVIIIIALIEFHFLILVSDGNGGMQIVGGVSYVIFNSGKYVVFNGILQFIVYTKEKNAILFTYPPAGSFTSTGLIVSSKLPRFSDLYTLTISSSDPKSISANEQVQFTKSVTRWFTKDGVLVEGLFWKDVEALIDEYAREPKKSK
uniref:Signal peptidase complex subunit 2 n=1 Tax=Cucumis sativus TaxID=3659 RepID=A0A0A0KSD0_CUCSA